MKYHIRDINKLQNVQNDDSNITCTTTFHQTNIWRRAVLVRFNKNSIATRHLNWMCTSTLNWKDDHGDAKDKYYFLGEDKRKLILIIVLIDTVWSLNLN